MPSKDNISVGTREEAERLRQGLLQFSASPEAAQIRERLQRFSDSPLAREIRKALEGIGQSPHYRGLFEAFNKYSEKNQRCKEALSTKMKKGPGRPRNTTKNAAIDQYVRENKNKPRLPLNAEAFEVKKIEREMLEKRGKTFKQPISKGRDRNLERKINNAFIEATVQNSD
jgi:hypothetical protein